MKRTLIISSFVIIIAAVAVVYYLFNKPHRDVTQEDHRHEILATTLIADYHKSVEEANTKYLDHVILVGGEVTAIDSVSITLAPGVFCHMHEDESTEGVSLGDFVDLKGRVVGYDDLFDEIRMDFCHFEKE